MRIGQRVALEYLAYRLSPMSFGPGCYTVGPIIEAPDGCRMSKSRSLQVMGSTFQWETKKQPLCCDSGIKPYSGLNETWEDTSLISVEVRHQAGSVTP